MAAVSPPVAIVIPYFQCEPGRLRATLDSVLAQDYPGPLQVIVVDDGSPHPTEGEIAAIAPGRAVDIEVIHQPNAGPGAARNRGLDAVRPGTEFVAYLDSDDTWTAGHVTNGIHALSLGYDFYFSDFLFSDYKERSAFTRAEKISGAQHREVDAEREIFEFAADMTDQILVVGNVIGTSNVLYRFAAFPDLRFREEYFNGQDYFFWLDLCAQNPRICFSTRLEAECGVGVNIYAGAGWGTARSLERLRNEIKLWHGVARDLDLTARQHSANQARLARLRSDIVADVLHRLRMRESVPVRALLDIIRYDSSFVLRFFPEVARLTLEKMRSMKP